MTKEEVRSRVREQKRRLAKEEILEDSKAASQNIASLTEFVEAEELFVYVSYNQEIRTIDLIETALMAGKRVAVPLVEGKEIEFYYITSLEELTPGYQGIPEPLTRERAVPRGNCFMLMPGLAFSKKGKRIGYGGGFYDKYLCRYKAYNFVTCGFAYEFQLFTDFQTEEFDQQIDYVVTPENIYHCHNENELNRLE